MTRHKLTDEDVENFRNAVKDVTPLKKQNRVEFKINPHPNPPPKRGRESVASSKRGRGSVVSSGRGSASSAREEVELDDFLSDHIITTVHADEKLFFSRGGLQHTVLRDLRQGKIIPVASIDLHKMTVEQARKIVTLFLSESLHAHYRCVHIIHGKGKLNVDAPKLKNHVNSWLQQHPDVLAFCSAIPRDGGVGAVYVLLRRIKGV